MDNVATHIVFSYPMQPDISVPIAEAFDWSDQQDKMWHPKMVIWEDKRYGGKSYAKGWWQRHGNGYKLVRVGAGAYGDLTVLQRELKDE